MNLPSTIKLYRNGIQTVENPTLVRIYISLVWTERFNPSNLLSTHTQYAEHYFPRFQNDGKHLTCIVAICIPFRYYSTKCNVIAELFQINVTMPTIPAEVTPQSVLSNGIRKYSVAHLTKYRAATFTDTIYCIYHYNAPWDFCRYRHKPYNLTDENATWNKTKFRNTNSSYHHNSPYSYILQRCQWTHIFKKENLLNISLHENVHELETSRLNIHICTTHSSLPVHWYIIQL